MITAEQTTETAKSYTGFYILTDRYPGLPKALGFYTTNANCYANITVNTGSGSSFEYRKGFGIPVQRTVNSESKYIHIFSAEKKIYFPLHKTAI